MTSDSHRWRTGPFSVKPVEGMEVNAIINLVRSFSDSGDHQLTVIALALIAGCKSANVEREHMLSILNELWGEKLTLVPLPPLQ
jgi:hypothetical protein